MGNKMKDQDQSTEKLALLIKNAEQGDQGSLAELKSIEWAHIEDYAREVYELARVTENALISAVVGDNLIFREGLQGKLTDLKNDLAGESPTALEHLLIERILCSWILTNYADLRFVDRSTERTLNLDAHYQKWQDRAQKRFLQSCTTLAQIRKLLGLSVQINVANNQINMMGQADVE